MENKKNVIPEVGAYVVSIVTTIISTIVFAVIAYFGYGSLDIKFTGGGADALAYIFLIPILILSGIALLVVSTIGLISIIKCISSGYKKKSSIVFLILHSLYILSSAICMIILFV